MPTNPTVEPPDLPASKWCTKAFYIILLCPSAPKQCEPEGCICKAGIIYADHYAQSCNDAAANYNGNKLPVPNPRLVVRIVRHKAKVQSPCLIGKPSNSRSLQAIKMSMPFNIKLLGPDQPFSFRKCMSLRNADRTTDSGLGDALDIWQRSFDNAEKLGIQTCIAVDIRNLRSDGATTNSQAIENL